MSCRALPFVLAVLIAQNTAVAKPSGDKAAADAAFREGRALMQKGAHAEACPRFEEALARYESASAALNLGRCYAKLGRLAAARTTLDRAKALNEKTDDPSRKREITRVADEDLADLATRLAHLRIRVTPAVEGTVVVRNGIEVPAGMLDRSLAVDPGTVTVRASAPGYAAVERMTSLEEGETDVLELSLVHETEPGKASEPAVAVNAPRRSRSGSTAAPSAKLWPWLVGGAGLTSLGFAAGFGVDFAMAHDELETLCPNETCPKSNVTEANEATARWDRDVALLSAFGAAGVGLVVTSVVGLALDTKPAPVEVGAVVTPDVAALSITIPID